MLNGSNPTPICATLADADAAIAILKHNTPCGVGTGADPVQAWDRAFATDPESPFGGIIIPFGGLVPIAAGGSQAVLVTFTPTAVQTYTDPLGWSIDYPDGWSVEQIHTSGRVTTEGAIFVNEPSTVR